MKRLTAGFSRERRHARKIPRRRGWAPSVRPGTQGPDSHRAPGTTSSPLPASFRPRSTTRAKFNSSSRSGIGGVLSATLASMGLMTGRSKRRMKRYSNSDRNRRVYLGRIAWQVPRNAVLMRRNWRSRSIITCISLRRMRHAALSGDARMAVQLHRRDPFLVLGHEADGLEPHGTANGSLVESKMVPPAIEDWRWQRLHWRSVRLVNRQHRSWPH